MYIHELKEWPNFSWDHESLGAMLVQIRHQQGRLIGGMESIGLHPRDETFLHTLTQDVLKSSEIEGEILDRSSVRSSVARHLGMENAALKSLDRNVEGIVEMIIDATQNFDQPLTKERLLNWHATLFPEGRSGFSKIKAGALRSGPVQIVSGHFGKEKVHFEGPSADRLDHEMDLFLQWLNGDETDPVLKAAVAHFWFETIHPFEDGNGRIGRAIADMLLARSENSPRRFYSLSAQIQLERKHYYSILEKTSKGGIDITPWIAWFYECLGRAIESSLASLAIVVHKTQYWDALSDVPLNERQRKMINLMLEGFKGKVTSSKWAKITKCSQDTAYRDILDLTHRGLLLKNPGGGRSTSYSLSKIS